MRIATLLIFIGLSVSACKPSAKEEGPPNILLIISDDQSWTDYSFMGHPHISTPRIDQLAEESLTFTHGYVTAPLCRPSLASMITGLYPHQHGITGNDPAFSFEGQKYRPEWMQERGRINRQLVEGFQQQNLLTQRLAPLGYQSLQTGKWWEGSREDGFFSAGMTHGDPANGGRHGDEGLKIGREGLQVIYDHIDATVEADAPFFVWYAPFLPHAPHTPPKALEEKYTPLAPSPAVARYWAMCEWFDQSCGQLLDYLDQKGLRENTLVVYVCDNGWIQDPERPNRYAPRSKQSPYDMGIRTPIMYRWPGKIQPKTDTLTLVSSIDIVPTIMQAVGLESDLQLPGHNVLDRASLENRSILFAEDYAHDIANLADRTQALEHRIALQYPWKLIVPDTVNVPGATPELFNLANDPHEQDNLFTSETDIANDLMHQLEVWWNEE